MIDGIPVLDAVVHSWNYDPSNYRNDTGAWIAATGYQGLGVYGRPEIYPARDRYLRDWSIEETANQLFLESDTDLAVHHVLPLWPLFKDGGCSLEKTIEAKKRWPGRFITYAGVDPLQGQAAIDELERQFEILNPIGLKLYPNSWVGNEIKDWRMDDPEVAFPVFQRALELGIKVVAIHKAIPLGPVPLAPFRVDDIDRAAATFPDLAFEIVHGGISFLEETAWQLARFSNVYVNFEVTSALVLRRPGVFGHALASLLRYGGDRALDKIFWGTGAITYHPQQFIEAFVRDFDFSDELVERHGLPRLTKSAKRKILGENYAKMAGFDLSARVQAVQDDAFADRRRANGGAVYSPYSTMLPQDLNEAPAHAL